MLDDLGIDGDEAADFFVAFGAEFEVELEPLYRNWPRHFGQEGFPVSAGLLMVAVACVIAVPAAVIGLPSWAVIGLSLAASFGWLFGLRAWPLGGGKALEPVTIEDLIHAAQAGRWPESDQPPS
ncbi:hypothetical protein [Brevundimonas sp.]|uniref:hypothetical protein n=1 Tax=Brevundimonas sp. TaxID=1871086 RepID=UPI0012217011|nr:hypothetical protein [Brevundimonas sp.]TAJ62279.1 MAG: hypothetical protein EPO49_08530 [Brevundimonas sp.]